MLNAFARKGATAFAPFQTLTSVEGLMVRVLA